MNFTFPSPSSIPLDLPSPKVNAASNQALQLQDALPPTLLFGITIILAHLLRISIKSTLSQPAKPIIPTTTPTATPTNILGPLINLALATFELPVFLDWHPLLVTDGQGALTGATGAKLEPGFHFLPFALQVMVLMAVGLTLRGSLRSVYKSFARDNSATAAGITLDYIGPRVVVTLAILAVKAAAVLGLGRAVGQFQVYAVPVWYLLRG